MEDQTQERLIAQAKAVAELKMRGHYREQEELQAAAQMMHEFEGNRKQRRAFAARNRRKDK